MRGNGCAFGLATLIVCSGAAQSAPSSSASRITASLSVEEKIGQLFMVAIDTGVAAKYEPYIRSGKLGGGLLRWDRFTRDQAREFTSLMQRWASSSTGRMPFLIAADHEGGSNFTQRSYGATIFPGSMALGAARSVQWAEESAAISGQELRALGIHINFAPVIDVNNNPDNPIIGVRSFGEDPATVAALGSAAIRGYLRGGVIPVAKHFPGHGDTNTDSHLSLPVIRRSVEELNQVELVPFRAAIAAQVPMIMPAHILFPAIEPGNLSVTLSSHAVDGWLREQLGFEGVVVTDSLDMGAIANTYGTPDAAVMALKAGCDLLLLGKEDFPGAYSRVLQAVQQGEISAQRLDLSVQRVVNLKKWLGLFGHSSGTILPIKKIGQKQHKNLARKIAENSVTLLRNEESLIPLRLASGKKFLVLIFHSARSAPEVKDFVEGITKRHPNTKFSDLPLAPNLKTSQEAVEEARKADVLLIGTFNSEAAELKEQTGLVQQLRALGKPLVLMSLLNPYDLRYFEGIKTALCTYGVTEASLDAAVRLMFGEIKFQGKLPVTIPGFAKRGDGL